MCVNACGYDSPPTNRNASPRPTRSSSELTARQIVEFADQNAIDLIVMGTHGRRGVAHLLLGSVAEHVVRTATCPVLTVRDAGTPKHGQTEQSRVSADRSSSRTSRCDTAPDRD